MAADVKVKPRLPKGMRDILPDKMILRQYVISVIQGVFEEFGFEPLQTPALEMSSTFEGKNGPEAERLFYDARHRGGHTTRELPADVDEYIKKTGLRVIEPPSEELSLRYDLTVPLCRVIAMYPDLPKPFKRYQISPVWRAERPQKGRYREFWQCDADSVGSASMLADAETINVAYEILKRLGFSDFVIKINNRKILVGVGEFSGVPKEQLPALYRPIDKLDKIGLDGVKLELQQNAIADDVIVRMLDLLQVRGESRAQLVMLKDRLAASPLALEGIAELEELLGYLDVLGIPTANYQVDFAMVRGLEYYTGPIYETVVEKPKIGSITGGGRYDNLVGMFMERSLPVTGTTIGIERIIDVMDELKMYPPDLGTTTAQVLVTIFQPDLVNASLQLATALRKTGVKVQLYSDPVSLQQQISYASRKGIPYIAILGPDEAASGQVTIRKSRAEQKTVAWNEVAALVKQWQ